MGQLGVSGSDVQRGLRWESSGIVLFVDENHPNAHSVGDGTDPEEPLDSIQTAINNLIAFATAMAPITLEGSVIVVASEATIAETVTIPATAPTHCMILGAGSSNHQPTWAAATDAGTALTVLQTGCRNRADGPANRLDHRGLHVRDRGGWHGDLSERYW